MLKHDITAWHCPVIVLQLHGRALISAYATSAPLPCQSVSPLSPNMWRHNFLEDPCNISLHCSSTVKELPKVKLTLAGPEVNRLTLSALSQPRLPFLTSCPNFLHAAILRSKRWPWEPTCEEGHVITYSSNFHLLGIEAARFWWFYKKKILFVWKKNTRPSLCGIYASTRAGRPGEPVISEQDGSPLSREASDIGKTFPLSWQQRQGIALSVSPAAEDERCQEHDIKCFKWFIFEGTLKTEARVWENKGKYLTI